MSRMPHTSFGFRPPTFPRRWGVRACFGRALGVFWARFGRALGVLWACVGRALGALCEATKRDERCLPKMTTQVDPLTIMDDQKPPLGIEPRTFSLQD